MINKILSNLALICTVLAIGLIVLGFIVDVIFVYYSLPLLIIAPWLVFLPHMFKKEHQDLF